MATASGNGALSEFMTCAEVAQRFNVEPRTVSLWGRTGKLDSAPTPGGHRRYRRSSVEALLGESPPADADSLHAELAELRGEVARLQADVRDLYARTSPTALRSAAARAIRATVGAS